MLPSTLIMSEVAKPQVLKKSQWQVDDIQIGYRQLEFNALGSFSSQREDEYVRLHFGLKGDYRFTYEQLGKSFDLIGGHHNIMYSNGLNLIIENKSLKIDTFGIDFPKERFIEIVDESDELLAPFIANLHQGKSSILTDHWGTLNNNIQCAIDDILFSPYDGQMQKVFLLAKSLELIVHCLDNYRRVSIREPIFIKNESDREKVMAARDYLMEHIHAPPTISEVSQVVGLNEFKLKRGFKEVFQTTMFDYLSERRLNLAKQLLLDTQKGVAQIAFELGYSSPQHFSNQFRKKFGVAPNSVRKNP